MKERKTIALFTEGDNALLEGIMTEAILQAGAKYDYNILIFQSLMTKPTYAEGTLSNSLVTGESSIYKLPDYDMFDGLIILGELLRSDAMREIVECARKHNLPVIDVNNECEGCYNVVFDDVAGMKEMVQHIIREHGCRKINFVSGFEGNKESLEREAAYREALEAEGIPFEPERILYGEFYLKSVDAVRDYLQMHELPDAFVCANDAMAMFVTKFLEDEGHRVPEDVIVTGFDHLAEAEEYRPSITSVERSVYEAGEVAVELLRERWSGKILSKKTQVPAHLVLHQSCGCLKRPPVDVFDLNRVKSQEITQRDIFISHISEMWRDFVMVEDMETLLKVVCQHLEFFEWDRIYLCICDDIFGRGIDDEHRYLGYSPSMVMVKYHRGREPEFENVYYPNILPPLHLDGEEREHLIFIPMYMKERMIGYLWMPLDHYMQQFSMLYAFLTTVNSAISDFCLLREKASLVDKLDSMYVRDALTKLYNRFGMQRYVEKVLAVARRDGQKVMCIALDLDGLKPINDNYGHAAGDNAIVQVANALRQASERREVCCRSGGDEYLVFGIAEHDTDAQAFIQRVEDYLDHYNQMNNWPYRVACSCGQCIRPADQIHSLEDLVTEADKMLYEVKVRKKTLRE
ncbi:MAG: GGDEF domain-containing protein [Eubacteriales bacterium]|nr:GGDEF domain-containing protein [Eubacteriales bacterium]